MPTQTKRPRTKTKTKSKTHRAEILNELLARHRRELYRQAYRHVHRPSDVEDAMQDACAQFMYGYDGPSGTDALRWMLTVLKRCAWGIKERERHQRGCMSLEGLSFDGDRGLETPRGEDPLDPHMSAERAERCAEELAAVDRLKPDERTALLLLGLGYSYREIAETQGWTHTKVNRCIAEGRETLRAGRLASS